MPPDGGDPMFKTKTSRTIGVIVAIIVCIVVAVVLV